MSNETPESEPNPNDSSNEQDSTRQELSDIKRQIDRTVKQLSDVRSRLNKVRKNVNRELSRSSPTSSESEQQQISIALGQLKQQETAFGNELSDLEKTLADLWDRRRQLEGVPMPAWTPSADEAEEHRLRWQLMEIKTKQSEAAEKWHSSTDPAERSLQEGRFNELREQYNAVYNQLNEIREKLKKR